MKIPIAYGSPSSATRYLVKSCYHALNKNVNAAVLRHLLHELGERLVVAGAIKKSDDVFWLQLAEVETAARTIGVQQSVLNFYQIVDERRTTWERERKVIPPVLLPQKPSMRFMGIDFTAWSPARTAQTSNDTIKGQPGSPGCVTGPARVILSPGDFARMYHGEILVAKITTPAWTPLFTLAAAVVTDVGGPLSHSSIVAREYHIPAVLGTGVATERIRDGQRITVDGDRGVVKTHGY